MSGKYFKGAGRGGTSAEKEHLLPPTPATDTYQNIPADAQVQNVQSARVYVLGGSSVAEQQMNGDQEMTELRPRGAAKYTEPKQKPEDLFFEREIIDGDTLLKIALKYGCPVSEIKRINNLLNDQDFHARRTIKVPIKLHGLLNEVIEEENRNRTGAKVILNGAISGAMDSSAIQIHSEDEHYADFDDPSETDALFVRTISIRSGFSRNQSKQAEHFLNSMDNDLAKIRDSTKSYKDTLEDVTTALTCRRIRPLSQGRSLTQLFKCNGADCGSKWWGFVILMLVIGILTPIIFILYFEYMKPS